MGNAGIRIGDVRLCVLRLKCGSVALGRRSSRVGRRSQEIDVGQVGNDTVSSEPFSARCTVLLKARDTSQVIGSNNTVDLKQSC